MRVVLHCVRLSAERSKETGARLFPLRNPWDTNRNLSIKASDIRPLFWEEQLSVVLDPGCHTVCGGTLKFCLHVKLCKNVVKRTQTDTADALITLDKINGSKQEKVQPVQLYMTPKGRTDILPLKSLTACSDLL